MLKRTCPICHSTDVRHSFSRRRDSALLFGLRAKYRCRTCTKSFYATSNAAFAVIAAGFIIALAATLGNLGYRALGESPAERERSASAAQFNEILERAKRDDPDAQYELYLIYARGGDANANRGEAQSMLMRSAEQGHADAQYELASALREGVGVVQDFARALRWMQSAAANGNWKAHFNLGTMYRDGIGTQPNPVKAYIHFNVAAAHGIPEAATMRNAVMTQLSPDQLIAAQAQARKIAEGQGAGTGEDKTAAKGDGNAGNLEAKREGASEAVVDAKK